MSTSFLPFLDVFLALVTSSTEVGNTRPSGSHPESVAKIHEVSFYSLTSAAWDDLSATTDSLIGPDAVDSSVRDNYAQTAMSPQVFEHPCLPLTKILSSGSFYYAIESHWDLSSRLATRLSRDPASAKDVAKFDERFVWNEYIIRSLLDFRERLEEVEREDLDRCQFIVCKVLLASKLKVITSLPDLGHPRLCWRFYHGLARPTDGWSTRSRHPFFDLKAWLEKSRD